MVSPARRRRAWILLLLTWAVIAGVFGARYLAARRDEAARFDREAREQEALRQMDRIAAEPPTAESGPSSESAVPAPGPADLPVGPGKAPPAPNGG